MKRNNAGLVAFVVLAFSLACDSDTTAPGTHAEEFQVSFTSVVTPESIGPHQVLVVKLSGGLGCDGCYQFDRFQVQRAGVSAEISGRGIHWLDLRCTQFPSSFSDYEYAIQPPFEPGVFRVIARQPDGSAIERDVVVSTL